MDSSESALGAVFFLDISNKKMYNMNRVGENVTSIEEYDVPSINATTYAVSGLSLVGTTLVKQIEFADGRTLH